MTAEADGMRNALMTLEANLNAMAADLASHKQAITSAAISQQEASDNAAALMEAKAKLDELNSLIIAARDQ